MSNTTACPQANDFSLGCCCNSVQIQVMAAIGAYSLIFFLLWKTVLMEPLKIFMVALFEINRAIGTWMSCGQVISLNLFDSPGAGSKFLGGKRLVTEAVGHFGTMFWGFVCIVASADYIGVQFVAACISILLLILLLFGRTWRIVGSIFLMLCIIAAFWACTVLTVFNGLRFFVLAIGVTTLFFPLYNVCLVPKRPKGYDGLQDLEQLEEISTSTKSYEFVWGVISLAVAGLAVYLSLVVGSQPDNK